MVINKAPDYKLFLSKGHHSSIMHPCFIMPIIDKTYVGYRWIEGVKTKTFKCNCGFETTDEIELNNHCFNK